MENSIVYSFPYIIFIALIGFWGIFEFKYVKNSKRDSFMLYSLSFFYIIFLGLRGYIGYDCINYYTEYWTPLPIIGEDSLRSLFDRDSYLNFGFDLYMFIIKNIWNNYSFFIFVNTFIDWLFIVYFLKKYTYCYSLSLVLFLIMGGLIFEIDFVRNFKAILLFIYSIKFIEQRRFFPFILIMLIACSFHISAIIYILFYFIAFRVMNLRLYWCVFIIANILFIFQIPYLKYIFLPISQLLGGPIKIIIERYFNDVSTSYGISIGYIERVLSAYLCSYFYPLFKRNKLHLIFSNLFLYYLLFFFLFGEIRMVTLRLPFLFFFSYSVIIPLIYANIRKKIYRQILLLTIVFYSFLKIYGTTGLGMYQYDNLLFGIKTIEERQILRDEIIKRI